MPYSWNSATKTAWTSVDVPSTADFNMINNNLLFLKQNSMQDLFATVGDLPLVSPGGTITPLAIGTTNQVLTVSNGVPSWKPNSGSLVYSYNNCGGAL